MMTIKKKCDSSFKTLIIFILLGALFVSLFLTIGVSFNTICGKLFLGMQMIGLLLVYMVSIPLSFFKDTINFKKIQKKNYYKYNEDCDSSFKTFIIFILSIALFFSLFLTIGVSLNTTCAKGLISVQIIGLLLGCLISFFSFCIWDIVTFEKRIR